MSSLEIPVSFMYSPKQFTQHTIWWPVGNQELSSYQKGNPYTDTGFSDKNYSRLKHIFSFDRSHLFSQEKVNFD